MLTHIDRSGFVCCGLVVDDEFVRIFQSISNFDFKIARESFLAIFAQVGERNAVLPFREVRLPM